MVQIGVDSPNLSQNLNWGTDFLVTLWVLITKTSYDNLTIWQWHTICCKTNLR